MNNFLTIILVLFVFQTKSQNINNNGIGKIIVEVTSLDSIGSLLNTKLKVKHKQVKGCGTFGNQKCGYADYVYDKKRDILFSDLPKSKDRVVRGIYIGNKSKLKTLEGIGIGSTDTDLINKLGQPTSIDSDNKHKTFCYTNLCFSAKYSAKKKCYVIEMIKISN